MRVKCPHVVQLLGTTQFTYFGMNNCEGTICGFGYCKPKEECKIIVPLAPPKHLPGDMRVKGDAVVAPSVSHLLILDPRRGVQ